MIKDRHYWLNLDFTAAASRLPTEKSERLRSEWLGDILTSATSRCSREVLTSDFMRSLIGEPDRTRQRKDGEVWEYDWVGRFGPDEYQSCTPLVFQEGRLVGVEREGQIVYTDLT